MPAKALKDLEKMKHIRFSHLMALEILPAVHEFRQVALEC